MKETLKCELAVRWKASQGCVSTRVWWSCLTRHDSHQLSAMVPGVPLADAAELGAHTAAEPR